ncbi:MAG: cation transporter [Spirochaetales bacterium]|nr:cation transporter [Spirochaetales bacterium]
MMHNHHHEHASTKNIRLAFFLNFGFAVLEIIGGIWTNSLAIISDALHDMGDSFSLGVSWYLEKLSVKKRSPQYSYGYKRFSLLGAIINSFVIIIGSIIIIMEAIPRLLNPESVYIPGMIGLSIAGIVINGIAVLRMARGKKIHERIIMLHLLEDVLGWIAVLLASMIMLFTEIKILDPILSIAITVYILVRVAINLKKVFSLILQSVPLNIDTSKIEEKIRGIPGVISVHDVHFWSLDGDYHVSTIHIIVKEGLNGSEISGIKLECRRLMHVHNIEHTTIEIEDENEECSLSEC